MRCTEAQPLFTACLDDVASGVERQALLGHLSACPGCRSDYHKLENTRLAVASLGRKAAPPDLALKIRVSLSREQSQTWKRFLQRYMVRLEDAFNAFMFPATAGILTTVIFFTAMAGFFVQAQADAGETVPGLYLSPHLQTTWPVAADFNVDAPVVVQAYVDASGFVDNYDIISGSDNEQVRSQLNRALLLTRFSPAYAFGQPVQGTAIICFSHVNVKG